MKNKNNNKLNVNPYPSSKKFIILLILSHLAFAWMQCFAISKVWWALIYTTILFAVCIIKAVPYILFWNDANNEFLENERLKKELELERKKKPLCTSLPNLIIADFTRQLHEHLEGVENWSYQKTDVFGEILAGRVHLIIDGKKAVAILNKLEWQELVYLPAEMPQKDVKKKANKNYSLFAFEWVETNLTAINTLCQKAEDDGTYEAYLTDILPDDRNSWDAIVEVLKKRGFTQTEIAENDGDEFIRILR